MIIRITVNDNDFQNVLEKFCGNFYNVITYSATKITDIGESIRLEKEIRNLFNPNVDIELTNEVKKRMKRIIRESFKMFVEKNYKKDAEYLIDSLCVDILSRMEDRWENGEVFYWFQHSNKYLCQ